MSGTGVFARAGTALAAVLLLLALPARAQTTPDATLELVSQPVSHGPDDSLDLHVRIRNDGPDSLLGYGLVVGALNRVQTRSALHLSYDLSAAQAASSFPVASLPDDPLPPGGSIDVRIDDPVSSLVLLRPGSENGVYPLKLTLQDTLGATLDTVTTQLLFYSDPQDTRLTIVPVLPVHDVPARAPDGVFHPDDAGRYPLEEAVGDEGWLTSLLDVLEEEVDPERRGRRAPAPEPLRLGLVPSARLVEELADMADGFRRAEGDRIVNVDSSAPVARAAAEAIERFRALLQSDGVQTIVAPYSFADLPSLAATEGAVARQMTEAAVVLRSVLGRDVDPGWVFAPGGRLDTASLQELPLGGAGGLQTLFAPDSLADTTDPELAGCPVAALSIACPVTVQSGIGGPLTGYAFDSDLQRHLVDLSRDEDARVAMQRFFAETAMIREESPGLERVVHATLSTTWRPSARRIRTFLRHVARAPWLVSATPAAGLELTDDRAERDLVIRAETLPGQPSEDYFDAVSAATDLVEHFVSIGPPPAVAERLRRNVLVAAARAWWDERQDTGIAYAEETRAEILGEFDKIGAVGAAETTLTSREGPIQFVVFNDTGYEIRISVSLDARGDLEVVEPDRDLVVADNQQTISYDVTARASGIFPITVRLETPDGFEIQAPQTITVRSTEFNEIALGLTFGALAFLVLFYIVRGVRRRRRTNEDPEPEAGAA